MSNTNIHVFINDGRCGEFNLTYYNGWSNSKSDQFTIENSDTGTVSVKRISDGTVFKVPTTGDPVVYFSKDDKNQWKALQLDSEKSKFKAKKFSGTFKDYWNQTCTQSTTAPVDKADVGAATAAQPAETTPQVTPTTTQSQGGVVLDIVTPADQPQKEAELFRSESIEMPVDANKSTEAYGSFSAKDYEINKKINDWAVTPNADGTYTVTFSLEGSRYTATTKLKKDGEIFKFFLHVTADGRPVQISCTGSDPVNLTVASQGTATATPDATPTAKSEDSATVQPASAAPGNNKIAKILLDETLKERRVIATLSASRAIEVNQKILGLADKLSATPSAEDIKRIKNWLLGLAITDMIDLIARFEAYNEADRESIKALLTEMKEEYENSGYGRIAIIKVLNNRLKATGWKANEVDKDGNVTTNNEADVPQKPDIDPLKGTAGTARVYLRETMKERRVVAAYSAKRYQELWNKIENESYAWSGDGVVSLAEVEAARMFILNMVIKDMFKLLIEKGNLSEDTLKALAEKALAARDSNDKQAKLKIIKGLNELLEKAGWVANETDKYGNITRNHEGETTKVEAKATEAKASPATDTQPQSAEDAKTGDETAPTDNKMKQGAENLLGEGATPTKTTPASASTAVPADTATPKTDVTDEPPVIPEAEEDKTGPQATGPTDSAAAADVDPMTAGVKVLLSETVAVSLPQDERAQRSSENSQGSEAVGGSSGTVAAGTAKSAKELTAEQKSEFDRNVKGAMALDEKAENLDAIRSYYSAAQKAFTNWEMYKAGELGLEQADEVRTHKTGKEDFQQMSRALSELNKKLSRIEEAAREASGPVIIAPGVDYNETRKEIKLDQEKWLKDTFSGDAAARLVNQTLDYEDDNIHCDASFDRNTGEVVLNIRIKNSRAPYDSMWLSPFSQQIYAKTGERVEVPGFFGSDSFVDELGVPHKVTKIDTKNYYTPTAVDVLSRVKSFKVKISVPADAKEVQKTYDKNFTGVLRDTLVFQGQPLAVEWVTDYSVLPEATKEDFVKDAGRLNPKEVDSNWAMPNQTSRKFFASVQITIDEKNYKKVLDFLIALLKLKRYPFKDIYFSSNGSEASEVRDYFKKNCPDGIISSYTETGDPATDKGKITIYFGENSRIK